MGYTVITLVAIEADVVGCRADPKSLSINLERRFPNSEVIAGGDHSNRLGMRPTVILRAAKQIQRAHRHGEVRLFRNALDDPAKHGPGYVGVDLDPSRGGEDPLRGVFRAD